MEDEICMSCESDNGITNNLHCKYCGDPLCRNIWIFNHIVNTPIKIKTNKNKTCFEAFKVSDNTYNFSCYSTEVNFQEESIKFHIKGLVKPIFIIFDQVKRMRINRHPYFHHYCSLNLLLTNKSEIKIYRNNINLKLFEVLDKFLETKEVIQFDV